eukprot:549334-Amphidinium_carterae.2
MGPPPVPQRAMPEAKGTKGAGREAGKDSIPPWRQKGYQGSALSVAGTSLRASQPAALVQRHHQHHQVLQHQRLQYLMVVDLDSES